MKLRRIEVRNFRKLGHVVIDDLGDGLNVIVGDNEAGKSTLLAALRAALFERHRVTGQTVAAMLPYNQSVRPEVEIDFDKDGVSYRLRKAFSQRPEAELVGGGHSWSGDAADQQLAELLGFSPPGAGRSKPEEHHGIYGLLWVEQGNSHRALGVGAGREKLAAALEREIGEVTGGERGRVLLAAAEARRATFWDKRDNPRGRLKDLAAELETLRADRGEVERQLGELDSKVERLATIEGALARHARDQSLAGAKAELAAAETAAARITGLTQAAEAARAALERETLHQEAAENRLRQRRDLQVRLRVAAENVEKLQLEAGDAASLLARLEGAGAIAARLSAEGKQIERDAAEAARRLDALRAARQLRDGLGRLETQAAAAEEAEAARLAALAATAQEKLGKADLDGLETLGDELARHRARLEAASVRISLHPEPDGRVEIDGVAHAAGEVTLSRDSVLAIAGYGRIEIHPGGGVEPLRQALATAEARLADALARLGQADLAAARAAFARRLTAEADAKQAARLVASFAPDGLARMREALALLRRQVAALPAIAEPGAAEAADAVRHRHDEAVERSRRLDGDAAAAEAAMQAARTAAAVANDRLSAAHALQAREAEALATARLAASDEVLAQSATQATEACASARARDVAARDALLAADPESTRLALSRATQAASAIADDLKRLGDGKLALEIELRTLGKDGLGEKLGELEGRIALLTTQLATLRLEADAARLLHDTLAAAQRETKERWLAPVRESVAPYLRLIAADSTITLNEETLELDEIVRGGVAEPFSGLSVGAREQMAVITRLALADILRQGGQSSCVVLDDALVNTDEARLERMHLVLHKAAEQQQILILTCRERDFLRLGAPIHRM